MILTEADGHCRDLAWMTLALDYAARGAAQGEVPVGAVLLDADGHLLAAAHNTPVQGHDPSAHAEMLVLRQAAQVLQKLSANGYYPLCYAGALRYVCWGDVACAGCASRLCGVGS